MVTSDRVTERLDQLLLQFPDTSPREVPNLRIIAFTELLFEALLDSPEVPGQTTRAQLRLARRRFGKRMLAAAQYPFLDDGDAINWPEHLVAALESVRPRRRHRVRQPFPFQEDPNGS